ncbi:hypothetical protein [Mycoplasma procyoni]|uniref:hypothetical protein n=1 Tax=Mycoplasma procyoni TaxID=568784 RepID=UPI00197BE479|nr:hypothetical protein [Mycoplasma procyoni]MBN3534675.1 hypothetical protein [Mycoplasma procyoni]
MSAQIRVSINDDSIITCDNLLQELAQSINGTSDLELIDEFRFVKKEIETTRDKLLNSRFFTTEQKTEALRNLVTQSRNLSNLIYMSKSARGVSNFNIYSYISKYGSLVIEAQKELENTNFSEEELIEKIDQIRQNKLKTEDKKQFLEFAKTQISTLNLSDKQIEFEFFDVANKIQNLQEQSDFPGFIKGVKNSLDRIDNLAKDIIDSLNKSEGFSLAKEPTIKKHEDEISGMFDLSKIYVLKNQKGNEIKIQIDSNLDIKYKLGNYIGHACIETSDRLLSDLKNKGYFIDPNSIRIKRDIDANKPLYKAMNSRSR